MPGLFSRRNDYNSSCSADDLEEQPSSSFDSSFKTLNEANTSRSVKIDSFLSSNIAPNPKSSSHKDVLDSTLNFSCVPSDLEAILLSKDKVPNDNRSNISNNVVDLKVHDSKEISSQKFS